MQYAVACLIATNRSSCSGSTLDCTRSCDGSAKRANRSYRVELVYLAIPYYSLLAMDPYKVTKSAALKENQKNKSRGAWVEALAARLGTPIDVLKHVNGFEGKDEVKSRCGLYLWRHREGQEWLGSCTRKLNEGLGKCFEDLKGSYSGSLRRFTVNNSYCSFQGNLEGTCSCKYDYDAASQQPAFNAETSQHDKQPESVAETLRFAFDVLESFRDATHKPVKFNLAVVNRYTDTSEYIPWHHDQMQAMSVKSQEDAAEHPVLSWSFGSSQLFCISLSQETWIAGAQAGTGGQWSKRKLKLPARAAFFLNHGDILLMTGNFQEYFVHRTLQMVYNPNPQAVLGQKNLQYLHLGMTTDCVPQDTETRRFCITARINKYHPGRPGVRCDLQAVDFQESRQRRKELGLAGRDSRGRSPNPRRRLAEHLVQYPRKYASQTPSPERMGKIRLQQPVVIWNQGKPSPSAAAQEEGMSAPQRSAGSARPRSSTPAALAEQAQRSARQLEIAAAKCAHLDRNATKLAASDHVARLAQELQKHEDQKALLLEGLVSVFIHETVEQMTVGDRWTCLSDDQLDDLSLDFQRKVQAATQTASADDKALMGQVKDCVRRVWQDTLPKLKSLHQMARLVRELTDKLGFKYCSHSTRLPNLNSSHLTGYRSKNGAHRVLMRFEPLKRMLDHCSIQMTSGNLALAEKDAQEFYKMAKKMEIVLLKMSDSSSPGGKDEFQTYPIRTLSMESDELPKGWQIEITEFEVGCPDSTVIGESRGWTLAPMKKECRPNAQQIVHALANVLSLEKRYQWDTLGDRELRFKGWGKNQPEAFGDMPAILWVTFSSPDKQNKRARTGNAHRSAPQSSPWTGNAVWHEAQSSSPTQNAPVRYGQQWSPSMANAPWYPQQSSSSWCPSGWSGGGGC